MAALGVSGPSAPCPCGLTLVFRRIVPCWSLPRWPRASSVRPSLRGDRRVPSGPNAAERDRWSRGVTELLKTHRPPAVQAPGKVLGLLPSLLAKFSFYLHAPLWGGQEKASPPHSGQERTSRGFLPPAPLRTLFARCGQEGVNRAASLARLGAQGAEGRPRLPSATPDSLRQTLAAIFNISSIKCPEIELHKQIGGKSVDLVRTEANPTFQPCLLCNYGLGLCPWCHRGKFAAAR